jgi:hypothetical protein
MKHLEQITLHKEGHFDIVVRRINSNGCDYYETLWQKQANCADTWKKIDLPNEVVEDNINKYKDKI